jgi:transcriptional regulator with XRE-family HTH domain
VLMTEVLWTPSEVIAVRLKELRQRRGLSVAKLAKECEKLGMPKLNRDVITNIEVVGRRQDVGVTELLVLALALDVPPALLLIPLDGRTGIQITPEVSMSSWRALFWLGGENEPPDREQRQRWRETIGPVHQHRSYLQFFNRAHRAEMRSHDALLVELRELARVIDSMAAAGITPPAVPGDWLKIMLDHDWLQYPDDVRAQEDPRDGAR